MRKPESGSHIAHGHHDGVDRIQSSFSWSSRDYGQGRLLEWKVLDPELEKSVASSQDVCLEQHFRGQL